MKKSLFLTFFVLIAASALGINVQTEPVRCEGRVGESSAERPVFYWPATSIHARFEGTSIAVMLKDRDGIAYYNAIVDGDDEDPLVLKMKRGTHTYSIATNLTAGVHDIQLYRRTMGTDGPTEFCGFVLDEGASLLAAPKAPKRRIEIYGDSITCGDGNEAADEAGDGENAERNNYLTYGAMTARNLNAEYRCIARSGIGILKSWFDLVMPDYWYRLDPQNPASRWDFSKWAPDVVVVNLTQNDSWLLPREEHPPTKETIIQAYIDFVSGIRKVYPDAHIVCALGSMDATREGGPWPGYIHQAVVQMDDDNMSETYFPFTGWEKHPRVRHHQAMAEQLTEHIRKVMDWEDESEWFSLEGAPVESGNPVGEDGLVRNFEKPALRVTRTAAAEPKGTVFLFPGGAYRILDVTNEGARTEEQLNAFGYDVVRLEYNIGPERPRELALESALSVWRMMHAKPENLGICSSRFAVMGYSAGGHLAARLIERATLPPDDVVLVYPAYLEEAEQKVQVPEQPTSRLVVVMANNDNAGWLQGARTYVDAWKKAGGYAVFQAFKDGGHGFGMKPELKGDLAQWPQVLDYFLEYGPMPGVGPFNTHLPWFLKNNEGRLRTFRASKEQDMGSIVFLGDSIIRKWDLQQAFPELKVANRGISGDTTRGMLCRIQENVVDLKPKAVVFMGGINDLDNQPKATPKTIAANIRSMLEQLDASTPVLLCETLPSNYAPLDTVRAVNAAVDQVITDFPNVHRVKTFDAFLNADGSLNESLFLDGTHPNAAGYDVWRKILAPELFDVADTDATLLPMAKAWSRNSINAVIFRHNSVVTHEQEQFAAFYDEEGYVVLAKRTLGSNDWQIKKTQYKGNVRDAHNSISIMVDGEGYLHMSWDHHGHPLRYCRSKESGSLKLTEMMPMSGKNEGNVTYPEFYRLPDGNLIFLYRDGASGRGNLMMNYYDAKNQTWTQRQNGFIDGEGQRNAYWQMCVGEKGYLHVSWVWRESSDVASNHDMGYALSRDGGITWEKSTGEAYTLPITAANSEYAARIPTRHELINTTSMCADGEGNPYIVTYYRAEGSDIPQYHLIYKDGTEWKTSQVSQRKTPFSLSGSGSKRIPISRPRIVANSTANQTRAYMLFRDEERGNRVSVAMCNDLGNAEWKIKDLTDFSVEMWEPSYDTERWKNSKVLSVYVQKVGQGDGETIENMESQMASILEWKPSSSSKEMP